MPISVVCDNCFFSFSVSEKFAGRSGKCPECGETVEIPAPLPGKKSPKSATRRQIQDLDDDSDDDGDHREPRRRPRRRRSSAKSKNAILIGLAGGGGAALVVVLLVTLISRSGSENQGAGLHRDSAATSPPNRYATNASQPRPVAVSPSNDSPFGNSSFPRTKAVSAVNGDKPIASQPAGGFNTGIAPRYRPIAAANATPPTPPASPTPAPNPAGASRSLADLIEVVEPAVVRIDVISPSLGEGTGSGFIVDSAGLLVTNYHVIEGGTSVKAVFSDGGIADVQGFVKLVPEKDIAILKIDYPVAKLKPLKLASTLPRKGESVLACGAPLGLSFTHSEGIISAHREAEEIFGPEKKGTWVQTTTPISPGNSGGPLINMQGEVVAINTVTVSGAQNLNFGISSLDISTALRDRSQSVTAISPASVPMRSSSHGRIGGGGDDDDDAKIVDVTGQDLGKELFGAMTEMNILSIQLDHDPEGELSAYLRRQAEVQSRQAGITINNSKKALMLITMNFDKAGSSKNGRVVKLSAHILVVHSKPIEGERLYKVWEAYEELGTVTGSDFNRGKIPDRVRNKTLDFFKRRFADDYKAAQAFVAGKSK